MTQQGDAPRIESRIAKHSADSITVRGADLVNGLIGKVSFTEMFLFQSLGRMPGAAEVKIVDAVLVTLVEHGMTPSAIVSRLIALSSPEAMQAAIAAGLLGVGSQFVGTTEAAAALLREIVSAPEGVEAACRAAAERFRREKTPLPGFGHPTHKPDDPRPPRLFAVAEEAGVSGRYVGALRTLSREIDVVYGRHITINATGAIAALLCEIDLPAEMIRGVSVLSRCAGLVGHILEEQQTKSAKHIWRLVDEATAYVGPDEEGN